MSQHDRDHQVGVAIMVGSMFMAMVGAELLYDHLCDKVREIFKQQKPAPDIERLHPAELVGTFSRYKWPNAECSSSKEKHM